MTGVFLTHPKLRHRASLIKRQRAGFMRWSPANGPVGSHHSSARLANLCTSAGLRDGPCSGLACETTSALQLVWLSHWIGEVVDEQLRKLSSCVVGTMQRWASVGPMHNDAMHFCTSMFNAIAIAMGCRRVEFADLYWVDLCFRWFFIYAIAVVKNQRTMMIVNQSSAAHWSTTLQCECVVPGSQASTDGNKLVSHVSIPSQTHGCHQ